MAIGINDTKLAITSSCLSCVTHEVSALPACMRIVQLTRTPFHNPFPTNYFPLQGLPDSVLTSVNSPVTHIQLLVFLFVSLSPSPLSPSLYPDLLPLLSLSLPPSLPLSLSYIILIVTDRWTHSSKYTWSQFQVSSGGNDLWGRRNLEAIFRLTRRKVMTV